MINHLLRSSLRKYFSTVKLEVDSLKKTGYLTLDNQKKRNPLSLATIRELQDKLNEVKTKSQANLIKILIIQGKGPAFSAGHDLKELKESKNPKQIFEECTKMMDTLRALSIPTLCAVNGIAAAAGFQMAMTCDLIFATKKSLFSTPGVKWGLFCSTPGVELIRSINSQKKAKQMLLFGQPITATEAFNYGIINKVVEEGQLEPQINKMIEKANNLSAEVLALGKNVLSKQSKLDIGSAYCVATEGMRENIQEKQDCKQGLKAFSEKRHPNFTK